MDETTKRGRGKPSTAFTAAEGGRSLCLSVHILRSHDEQRGGKACALSAVSVHGHVTSLSCSCFHTKVSGSIQPPRGGTRIAQSTGLRTLAPPPAGSQVYQRAATTNMFVVSVDKVFLVSVLQTDIIYTI
jgi:hypothetical protein